MTFSSEQMTTRGWRDAAILRVLGACYNDGRRRFVVQALVGGAWRVSLREPSGVFVQAVACDPSGRVWDVQREVVA